MSKEERDAGSLRRNTHLAWRKFGPAATVAAVADVALFAAVAKTGQIDGGLAIGEVLNTVAWMTIWSLGDLASPDMQRIRALDGGHDKERQPNPLLPGRFEEVVAELHVNNGRIAGSGKIDYIPNVQNTEQ